MITKKIAGFFVPLMLGIVFLISGSSAYGATLDELESRVKALESEKKKSAGFEFHGYSRAGFGWNKEGGMGQRYRWGYDASGWDEHYWRLGNESHNAYTNLTLIQNIKKKDEGGDKSFAKFVASIIVEPRGEDNWEPTSVVMRQLYAEVGNFNWAPGVTFWAGEKWYRHPGDQHITDWQFLDIAGYGGGIGDIPLGKAKLSLALLGHGSSSDVGYPDTDNGEPVDYLFDVRIEDIPMGIGNIMVQFAPTWTKGGKFMEDVDSDGVDDEVVIDSESGWMSSIYLNFDGFFGIMEGGYGRIIGRYGKGYGSTLFANRFMKPNSDTASYDNTSVNWEDSYRWSVMADGLMEFTKDFQFMPVVAYQYYDNGLTTNNKIIKILYGGRFKFGINKNVALLFEPGAIYLDSEPSDIGGGDHLKDTLYKATGAVAFQAESGFWARPEIRFYVTYAKWSDEKSGQYLDDNAGIDTSEDTSGMTYGMQFEAWW